MQRRLFTLWASFLFLTNSQARDTERKRVDNLFESIGTELFVSTVFHSKDDPQRITPACRTCAQYFAPWLESLKLVNISALILHDGLPEFIVQTYSSSEVTFKRVQLGSASVNDERFRLYYAFLTGQSLDTYPRMVIPPWEHVKIVSKPKKVFFTDIADVIVRRNPFYFVNNYPDHVFVGSENRKWIMWMRREVRKCGLVKHKFQKSEMYNAGILGGRSTVVAKFLHDFVTLQSELSLTAYESNCDMPIFNAVVYGWLKRQVVFWGQPLHSRFLAFDCNRSDAYICHK